MAEDNELLSGVWDSLVWNQSFSGYACEQLCAMLAFEPRWSLAQRTPCQERVTYSIIIKK